MEKLYLGDCLDVLPTLPDNSVDSIVTDPPYELGFMGKSWDNSGIAYNVDMWKECLRVLKPGGHLLSFSGTRTYHRMAVAIEDAGFEIRDMIEWIYGSGFPKSLNIGKAVDKLQGNEREVVGTKKGQGNIPNDRGNWGLKPNEDVVVDKGNSPYEGWGTALKPSHEPVVFCSKPLTPRLYFAILIGDISNNIIQLCQISNVKDAEKIFSGIQAKLEKEGVLSVADNVRINAWESLENVKFAEKSFTSKEQKSSDLTKTKENSAQLNAKQNGKKDNLQEIKTLAGVEANIKALMDIIIFGTTEDTSQNIALLWNSISEELLNQANTLTISMATRLITDLKILKLSATQSILESTGSLFKTPQNIPPNHEPICMARKPLSEKTVVENVLKWGTGGINIDESRVESSEIITTHSNGKGNTGDGGIYGHYETVETGNERTGRFPANLIHDNSEEVRECFPETKSGGTNGKKVGNKNCWLGVDKEYDMNELAPNSGNASRFFRAIPQVVDYNDFSIYNRSILTNIKQLCGQHLTKKKTGIMLDGVIQEAERFIQDAELLTSGNNTTIEKSLTDIVSTTKTLTQQMTELKTLNVLPNWLITKFTEESEKTIKSLKELNTENVKSAKSIFLLQTFISEVLENIRAIAEIVAEQDSNNGEKVSDSSRFFKSIIYTAKASKSERNKGCEGLYWLKDKQIDKELWEKLNQENEVNKDNKEYKRHSISKSNNHATVKNVSLMEYLIKMVTPKGGIVLEPFAGSGSTLVAAKENGFGFIGIELTEDYIPIIEARTGVKAEKIQPIENVIQKTQTEPTSVIKEKPINTQKPKNDIDTCECGGRIVKTASGRCCEQCLADY